MLVTFSCDAHENIMMFGDVALKLLKMMGHSGTVPGAIVAKDVPDALEKLTQSINRHRENPPASIDAKNEDDDEVAPVSIVHRAFPLIELLKDAAAHKCDVLWK
jgi:hypothetical protein